MTSALRAPGKKPALAETIDRDGPDGSTPFARKRSTRKREEQEENENGDRTCCPKNRPSLAQQPRGGKPTSRASRPIIAQCAISADAAKTPPALETGSTFPIREKAVAVSDPMRGSRSRQPGFGIPNSRSAHSYAKSVPQKGNDRKVTRQQKNAAISQAMGHPATPHGALLRARPRTLRDFRHEGSKTP
jgi:hypothetical protein